MGANRKSPIPPGDERGSVNRNPRTPIASTSEPVTFDVAFLLGVPWDSPRQRPHQLASQLARFHRILYVEQSTRRGSELLRPLVRRVEPRVTCLHAPFLAQPFRRPRTRRLEVKILAFCIRLMAVILGMGNLVVIHCDFHSAGFIGALGEIANVYDCADDHAGFPWADPRTRELEDDLCRRADVVLAVSEPLMEARKAIAHRVALVPNAAELERFESTDGNHEPPSDIKAIASPVLGYIGAVYDWIDFKLLANLARAHPEWGIVLIGPIRTPLDALAGLSNVHLLGPRPYDALPRYLHAFKVALVPFKVNRLTRSADLIKVYEYLAAGIPVVGTNLPSLQRFGGVVRIGMDLKAFETGVLESLSDRSPLSDQRRKDAVRRDDWSSRASLVERLIGEAVVGKWRRL